MADQILITDPEAVKTIEKYAEQKGISKAEAGSRLVKTAKGRINAVRKYAAEHARPAEKKTRAPRTPKGPKAPKAPKAPRVRKAKAAATPPASPEQAVAPAGAL